MFFVWHLIGASLEHLRISLTAVRLFINRSQVMSVMWLEQKSGTQGTSGCTTDVLTTFLQLLRSINEQTHDNMENICFIW